MCSSKMKTKTAYLFGALLSLSFSAFSSAATVEVMQSVEHDESPPLSEMYSDDPQPFVDTSFLNKLILPNPLNLQNTLQDNTALSALPYLQAESAVSLGATISLNKIGIGKGFLGYVPFFMVPEPTGAVGDTQYVQSVDGTLAIFNKSTGAFVVTKKIYDLWKGFTNDQCAKGGYTLFNSVKYDQVAKRWVFTQAALSADQGGALGNFTECIAVSKTSDVLGAYNRYAIKFDKFNINGKLGLWHNSYYMTFIMLDPANFQVLGPKVCALERGKMLAGAPMRVICKQLDANAPPQLVPADLDGTLLPPAASPEFVLGTTLLGTGDKVMLYRFKTTWGPTPSLTSVSPVNLGAATFTHACSTTPPLFTCIPQKNGAPLAISFLGNHGIMNRVAYRQFPAVGSTPSFGSIVANHNIIGPNNIPSAIRWYQLKVPNTYLPTKVQQGTYTSDSMSYFNGSIAMDKIGNIALGYNVSSPTIFPSVEITGRTKIDKVNTFRSPMTVVKGTGALQGKDNQPPLWGTNSFLAIDPVDNCTFWYTTEYMIITGDAWSTRIAKFKLPGCK